MKLNRSFFVFSVVGLFAVLIAAVPSTSFAAKPEWKAIFRGVHISYREVDEPLQKVVALRINLKAKGIEFKTTPPHKDFKPEERETWRQTTLDFLVENKLAVAVNGNFYTPFNAETIRNPGDANVTGLAVSDGFVESETRAGFPSFLVKKDGSVEIRQVEPGEDLSEIQQAVSGPAIVLKDGEVVKTGDKSTHPRTAVGYSQDKRYVYFIVIDGRRPGYSMGATLESVGETLKYFGAHDGLNLDGGGSTTMVARGKDGNPYVLNRPINAGVNDPIYLRHNGNAIGVKARSL